MKKLLFFALASLTGCESVHFNTSPSPQHHHYQPSHYEHEYVYYDYCDDSEPYYEPAHQYYVYTDIYGNFEGECGVWYFGYGFREEWCNWNDFCGWEMMAEWHE